MLVAVIGRRPVGPNEGMTTVTAPARNERRRVVKGGAQGGSNAVYALGLIGALVFYWQQASSLGEYVVAVLKAVVWPAFLVYDVLRAVTG